MLDFLQTFDPLQFSDLRAARGARHSVMFLPGEPLLAILRTTCPFLRFREEPGDAWSLPMVTMLRLASHSVRIKGEAVLRSNPATHSIHCRALGRALLAHFNIGCPHLVCATLGEFFAVQRAHSIDMITASLGGDIDILDTDLYVHETSTEALCEEAPS
jgi:hypothetical protein